MSESNTPPSPFNTNTKGINRSSLTEALNNLRNDTLFIPHTPGWDIMLREALYTDLFGLSKGSEEQALQLIADFAAGLLGEMVWRAGPEQRQKVIDWFNKYSRNHESSFILKLVLESAVEKSKTVSEKNDV
jgi:hypothetical protein